MTPTVAYLSEGRLHIKEPEKPVREIPSHFAQTLKERLQQIHQRNEWKNQGRGAQFAGRAMGSPDLNLPAAMISSITSASTPGEVIYALRTDEIGGVFRIKTTGVEEHRLRHSQKMFIHYLCRHPATHKIACSVDNSDGTSSLAVMEPDASHLHELTEGDSLDIAPSWVPGTENDLIFQSAGLGRDREGLIIGLGPFAIEKLTGDTGEIETLLQDPKTDFLLPRLDGAGRLLYIRRPYKPPGQTSFWHSVWDAVMIPFRLLGALFAFLNAFSYLFSGKPLTRAGGPKSQNNELRQMRIWGHLVHAKATLDTHKQSGDETPDLVPRDWELCREEDGAETVLARGVLYYDLGPENSLVYTNGSGVFHLTADGKKNTLCKGRGIEQISILPG
ncbi:MAG: hypothetical protein SFY92_04455 [Verrucomicrobiae bacterium]|nr:hypothetical protein [Verrucomicrobiae bacterium]